MKAAEASRNSILWACIWPRLWLSAIPPPRNCLLPGCDAAGAGSPLPRERGIQTGLDRRVVRIEPVGAPELRDRLVPSALAGEHVSQGKMGLRVIGEIPHQRLEGGLGRSEEHTSELLSPCNLVCRLLLEKKK